MHYLKRRGGQLHLLAAFILLACCACGTSAGPRAWTAANPLSDSLPAPESLDGLSRAVRSQAMIEVSTPLQQHNASVNGEALELMPTGTELAYAVFRVAPLGDAVLSFEATGSDGFWLLLADYGTGRWYSAGQFNAGAALGSLGTLVQPVSPDRWLYCAVVAPPGIPGQLSALWLNYDGPAHTYYVAPPEDGGSDSNDGSAAAPWATLQHAADSSGPDTRIVVRPGLYDGFKLGHGGSEAGPILFMAEAGAVVDPVGPTADGIVLDDSQAELSYVVVDGFTVQGANVGIRVVGQAGKARYITLRNNNCNACDGTGIVLSNTDSAVLEANDCHDSVSGSGIQLSQNSQHCIVRMNACYNNAIGIVCADSAVDELLDSNVCFNNYPGPGIYALSLMESNIRNNLLYNNDNGIWLDAQGGGFSTDNVIANNTIVQDAEFGSCVLVSDGCTGIELYNNIILHANSPGVTCLLINTASLPGFMSDNNIFSEPIIFDGTPHTLPQWQAASLTDSSSQVAAPELLFVDPGNVDLSLRDYHLLPGCPAVSAAAAAYLPPTDLDGVLRPQGLAGDCGCYEFTP